jgi:hypothetical protein
MKLPRTFGQTTGRRALYGVLGLVALHSFQAVPVAANSTITAPDISLEEYLPSAQVEPLLKSIGFLTAHRPYLGASSLAGEGSAGMGLDIGIEATLMGIPSGLSIPGQGTALDYPSLPIAKLHIARAFGPQVDIATSGIWYLGSFIAGGSVSLKLYQPPEGFEWAIRGGLSFTDLNVEKLTGQSFPLENEGFDIGSMGLTFKTQTYTLHLVGSKRLDFAEPYIAAGISSTQAQIVVPVRLTVLDEDQQFATTPVSQLTGEATLGVRFRIPSVSLRIGLEGSYNSASMHTLGMKVGVAL